MDAVTQCNPYVLLKSTLEAPTLSAHEKVIRLLGLRLETMDELAKAAGCCRMTLYRVISPHPPLAPFKKKKARRWNPEPIRLRIAAHLGVEPGLLWPDLKAAGEPPSELSPDTLYAA